MSWMNLAVMALLATQAAEPSADELARRGRRAFNLQAYDEAVDLLSKAYRMNGDPALLFGIAQAYRKSDRCAKAVEFYERYRAACTGDCRLDPRTTALIEQSRQTCASQRATAAAPPRGMAPEPEEPPEGPPPGPGEARIATPTPTATTTAEPSEPARWRLLFEGAGAGVKNGDVSGLQSSFRGGVGYGFGTGAFTIGPAAVVEFLPVAYEHQTNGELLLVDVSARAIARYDVAERAAVRGEAGLGLLVVSGQGEGVPLRSDRSDASTTLATFVIAAGVDVWVTEVLGIAATLQARTSLGAGALEDGFTVFTFGGGPTVRW